MTTQTKKAIHGKVARVLNSREVALNIGREQGVEVGMLFDILTPKGHDIRDPDTGEVLGSLGQAKTRVKVARVLDKLSLAATYRVENVVDTKSKPTRSYEYVGMRLFEPPRWVTRRETLRTTEATWDELSEEDRNISTGDPVVQVFHDDDWDEF